MTFALKRLIRHSYPPQLTVAYSGEARVTLKKDDLII